jgi:guanine deaminase
MRILRGNIIEARSLGKLRTIEHGYIILNSSGVIRGVYEELPPVDGKIEDYGDALILQGFCDMHIHAPQYPLRGMGMDKPLIEWLNEYVFPLEAEYGDTDYAGEIYRSLASKLIRNGTTRVCMFSSLHTDATLVLMKELEKAGISGYVGKVNMDRNGGENLQETTEESERETLRWLEESKRFTRIKPIITPRFTPACTDELMAWLGKTAEERGLRVQSHLSENRDEIRWVKSLHPDCEQYWETYDKYGLFRENTLMAHCVYSDEREIRAMKEKGVVCVHCPDSNVNLTSGTAPIRRMLDEGVRVVLGSDVAAGADVEMYKVAASAVRTSKIKRMEKNYSVDFLSASEAYYLATTAGELYFGDEPGFAPGNRLHAVVVDDSSFPRCPKRLTLTERLERALYLMNEENIIAVWAEGRKVR